MKSSIVYYGIILKLRIILLLKIVLLHLDVKLKILFNNKLLLWRIKKMLNNYQTFKNLMIMLFSLKIQIKNLIHMNYIKRNQKKMMIKD